jgi:hypothetical protein
MHASRGAVLAAAIGCDSLWPRRCGVAKIQRAINFGGVFMHRFASVELWPLIEKLAAAGGAKHAAIAYVADDASLSFGQGDVLVTDASDASIMGARTSPKLLRDAHRRGARLYSVPGLHAKVVCIGRHAVVSSANASANSRHGLVEAGIVTDDPRLFASVRAFIEQLVEGAEEVDEDFLARIGGLEVERAAPNSTTSKKRLELEDRQPRIWLVGVHLLDESKFEHEANLAEEGQSAAEAEVVDEGSEVSWLRFTGNSKFRREARRGDSVIQLWRDTYKSKSPVAYLPAPILRRQDESSCTRFYVEEFSELAGRALSWREFLQIWDRASGGGDPPAIACAKMLRDDVASMLLVLWSKKTSAAD